MFTGSCGYRCCFRLAVFAQTQMANLQAGAEENEQQMQLVVDAKASVKGIESEMKQMTKNKEGDARRAELWKKQLEHQLTIKVGRELEKQAKQVAEYRDVRPCMCVCAGTQLSQSKEARRVEKTGKKL